jgi:hypothetical protein
VADSTASALRHLARAAEEFTLALGAALQTLGERTHARAVLHRELRAEERRWRARAASDSAAARVAELFSALADVFEEAPPHEPRDSKRKFDPPRVRWDTRARWRS